MKNVISVYNLSKRFRIGLKENSSETLVGSILGAFYSPWNNLKRLRGLNRFGLDDASVFWALNDLSFNVKEGEVLGIIGKNGAGKSTLLKILSQITEPTSGKVEIYGRVASLLEVGTGFHPELTGRDNIYMNGTILGMTRREIDSKLDEIIDFSGVEKFIDTPVKFYSSGMKVRLGFSVAAHLDPEILIVDEVLSVGDAEFQKKCMGKMDEVSKVGGRSILFVSHNLKSLSELCSTGILLDHGKQVLVGSIDECISKYNTLLNINNIYDFDVNSSSPIIKPTITFVSLDIDDSENGAFLFTVKYKSPFELKKPIVGIVISDEFGSPLCGFNNRFYDSKIKSSSSDTVIISVKGLILHTGQYYVSAFLGDSLLDYFMIKDVIYFNIENKNTDYLKVPSLKYIGGIYIKEVEFFNQ